MANIIFRGSNVPQFQKWRQTYSPRRGLVGEYFYRGLATVDGLAQMTVLAEDAALSGDEFDFSSQFGVAELTVRTPDGEVVVAKGSNTITDRWEVGTDEEKLSLFENQNFLGLAQALDQPGATFSSQLISIIITAANAISQTEPINTSIANWSLLMLNQNAQDDSGADYQSDEFGNSVTLYNLFSLGLGQVQFNQLILFVKDYLRGATNFEHSKYVLRHTTNVPNNYTNNVADFNVEKIYTIAQLLSEAQNSALWVLPLPSYLAFKIANYPVPINIWNDYLFGALKLRSNAVTTARNRIEITQEYLIDTWPIHTYGTIA